MVQLKGTYYVGSPGNHQSPSSAGDLDMVDIVCGLALFVGWIAVFLRYGLNAQAFVFAALFVLLVVSGELDRKTGRAPFGLSLAMALLWLATLWFMPYGVGPIVSALGAGGLVPFFASVFGVGPLAVLLDGVLGAALMFVLCVFAVIIIGVLTGAELLNSSTFTTAMALGCYLGTLGSLVLVTLTLTVLLVFFVMRALVSSHASDSLLAPQLYSRGFGSGHKQKMLPVGLALAAATMIMIVFL